MGTRCGHRGEQTRSRRLRFVECFRSVFYKLLTELRYHQFPDLTRIRRTPDFKAFLQDARPSYAAAARCRSVPSRHRGLSALSNMTDQEQTMGEDAPSESATDDSDWKVVRSRQQRRRQEQFLLNNNAANLTSQHNHQGMKPQRIKGSVIKAGRMPRLPKEYEKTPTPLLASAILAASGIKREDAKEDILSPNAQQNIVTAKMGKPTRGHSTSGTRLPTASLDHINGTGFTESFQVQVTDQPEQGLIKIQIEDQGSDS
ncbi:hypothetical protein HPB50_026367 [Hyalomma asiaticum]|uniref:Uncharacterized protein n=1 Tax=Hyalomma asiaticum TaxID=266040 RepID=A0ACB7TUU2_HYAAI|nr:hypothetical protein HPB50_026367 [Hyalomma asiaticum]